MSFYGKHRIPSAPTRWYVALTLLAAFLLSIVFSLWLKYLPSFLALTIIFWSIKTPKWMTMFLAMGMGLIMEIILDKTMGMCMMEYLLLTTIMANIRYRFELMSFFFQSLWVGILTAVVKIPSMLLAWVLQGNAVQWSDGLNPILNALLWMPFLLLIIYPLYRPRVDELHPQSS